VWVFRKINGGHSNSNSKKISYFWNFMEWINVKDYLSPPPTGGANLLKGGGWLRGALPPFPPVDVDLYYMYNFTLKRKKMCFYLEK